jgi:GTP pyrophosphokinase
MFRHQFETFAILLEYGYEDSVLLKAALIHDLFEDGQKVGFNSFAKIMTADEDGERVFNLVQEVTIRITNNVEEPKDQFLQRIMLEGSPGAKALKLADRLSNINSLPATHDLPFIKKYVEETNLYILPYAEGINKYIAGELKRSLLMIEV